MFFSATKSNERWNRQIFGGVKCIFWIWRTYMQFRTPGVPEFFEMAYEKLFQVNQLKGRLANYSVIT